MGGLREEPANANMIGMFPVGVLVSRDAAFLCPSGLYYCVGYSGLMGIVKPQSLTIMAIDIINTAIILYAPQKQPNNRHYSKKRFG